MVNALMFGCADGGPCAHGFERGDEGSCVAAADRGTPSPDPQLACDAYADAYVACAEEAYGVDEGTYAHDGGYCTAAAYLTGQHVADLVALMDCYAAIYNSADCFTPEALSAASASLSDCDDAGPGE